MRPSSGKPFPSNARKKRPSVSLATSTPFPPLSSIFPGKFPLAAIGMPLVMSELAPRAFSCPRQGKLCSDFFPLVRHALLTYRRVSSSQRSFLGAATRSAQSFFFFLAQKGVIKSPPQDEDEEFAPARHLFPPPLRFCCCFSPANCSYFLGSTRSVAASRPFRSISFRSAEDFSFSACESFGRWPPRCLHFAGFSSPPLFNVLGRTAETDFRVRSSVRIRPPSPIAAFFLSSQANSLLPRGDRLCHFVCPSLFFSALALVSNKGRGLGARWRLMFPPLDACMNVFAEKDSGLGALRERPYCRETPSFFPFVPRKLASRESLFLRARQIFLFSPFRSRFPSTQ